MYNQKFTLRDIFNNPRLAGKLPLVNYQEGKRSGTTKMKTATAFVYDTSRKAARPFYRPMRAHRAGDTITIGGKLQGDHDAAVNAVFSALVANRGMLIYTANNMQMVRAALKESEKIGRETGVVPKLYLRANSMAEIEGMSKHKLNALMDNIMENIFYNDAFEAVQKKFDVQKIPVKSPYNYDQRKEQWQRRTGQI
jgi:hypothetical protein